MRILSFILTPHAVNPDDFSHPLCRGASLSLALAGGIGVLAMLSCKVMAQALPAFDDVALTFAGDSMTTYVNASYANSAIADFNGDGFPDVAVIGVQGGKLRVEYNGGAGTLSPANQWTGTRTFDGAKLAAGDVNGDGKSDIVVAGWPYGEPSTYIAVAYLGDGAGAFLNAVESTLSTKPYLTPLLGDIDGDGDLDLTIGGNEWYRNNGAGSFTLAFSFLSAFGEPSNSVFEGTLADIDGDGDLDLVRTYISNMGGPTLVGTGSTVVHIVLNNGNGTFATASPIVLMPDVNVLWRGSATADFNGDGRLDIVCARRYTTPFCRIFTNLGNGTFTTLGSTYFADIPPVSGPSGPTLIYDLACGDLDGNGMPDIALSLTTEISESRTSRVYFNRTNGTFSNTDWLDVGSESWVLGVMPWNPCTIHIRDMNVDGKLDIVQSTLAVPAQRETLGVVHLNHNIPDILTPTLLGAQENVAYSTTLQHDGGGAAGWTWSITAGTLPQGLALNTATGEISGTPATGTRGAWPVDITLTDATATPTLYADTESLTIFVNGSTLPLPYGTGFESGEYCPADLTAGSNARAHVTADAANGGSLGLRLDAIPGDYPWPLQPSGAGQAGADDPARWDSDATTHVGVLEWHVDATGVSSIDVGFDWAAMVNSFNTWYANLVLELDDGTGWRVVANASNALTNGIYRTTNGAFQTTAITASITPAADLALRLRWLVKYAAEDTFPTYVYVDNLSVVASGAVGALAITTSSLAAATEGQNYGATMQASGGTSPYTWSLNAATPLPGGLSLDPATGIIAGTPFPGTGGAGGTDYSLTIRVDDASGGFIEKAITLTVNPPSTVLAITTMALASGREGDAYSFTLDASGGTPPYTWNATGLPNGLSLDAATGIISGTPGAGTAGTPDITIEVGDSMGATALTQLPLIIVPPGGVLITITTTALSSARLGRSYAQTLTATGGTLPYTWSITSGALPGGLLLNPGTGAIVGTPATGSIGDWPFVARVTDSLGVIAIKPLTLTVAAAPVRGVSTGGGCVLSAGAGHPPMLMLLCVALTVIASLRSVRRNSLSVAVLPATSNFKSRQCSL